METREEDLEEVSYDRTRGETTMKTIKVMTGK
jgi:hypothetical protein